MRPVLLLAMAFATPAAAQPTFGNPFRFTEQGGEAIYQSICAGCHMQDGQGATGAGTYSSLINDSKLADPAYPVSIVLKGHKAMPPFADALTNDQVAAVVTYIRTHFGNDFPGPLTPEEIRR
jgi:mono/diheme cytochrome c family protein